jgi:hypothetical protein
MHSLLHTKCRVFGKEINTPRKIYFGINVRTWTFQPVASRYTDYAVIASTNADVDCVALNTQLWWVSYLT